MFEKSTRTCLRSQSAVGAPIAAIPLTRWLTALLVLGVALFVSPARATVALRVQPGTSPDPIQVFVTVTDSLGNPVGNLGAGDFRVALDMLGEQSGVGFTLPPSQDPNQRASVVIAMDYSGSVQNFALNEMQTAVMNFINAMRDGDYAAIVKFSGSQGATLVREFTVTNAGGKSSLTDALTAPTRPVRPTSWTAST